MPVLLRGGGLNFSAQNDVRVGLQWEDFLGKCSSKQINPHSYIFFGLPRGVKRCKSSGVICLLPPHSYTILLPLADQKSCKSGGLFCLLPPHSYTILPPWKPNAAQKKVRRVLSCIFLKNPPIAAPLIHNFTPLGSQTLTSFYPLAAQLLHHFNPSILHCFSPHTWRLPVLNPQPLYPQLRRLILQTIKACPTLDGLYIWIKLVRIAPSQQITPHSYIFLPPHNKLPPHSYNNLPPLAAQLLHHFNPSEQITPSLLDHFVPLGSPTIISFYHLWTNYPLTLTKFYPPWQPNSYIILPPLSFNQGREE